MAHFYAITVFFWSVVGLALKKKFEGSRLLRILTTSMGLILAIGTYYSIYRGWLHVSLQGMGLFGAVLIFIIVFFIVFGLLRGYGMQLPNALSLGYCLFYLCVLAVSPNIFDNLAEIFPPANGILLLIFIYSAYSVCL